MFSVATSAKTFVHGTGARRLPRYRSFCQEFFLVRKKTKTRALFRRKTNRCTFHDWNGSSGFPRQTSANSFEEAQSNAQNGVLMRNACIALGNSGLRRGMADHGRISELLKRFADSEDQILVESARWALSRIQ